MTSPVRKEIVIGKLFEETDLNISRDKKQIANSEGISPHQKLDEQAVIPAKPVYPGILPSEEPTHSEWKRGVRSSLHGIHHVPALWRSDIPSGGDPLLVCQSVSSNSLADIVSLQYQLQ